MTSPHAPTQAAADRRPVLRVWVPSLFTPGPAILDSRDAVRHARVRRVCPRDHIELFDGQGSRQGAVVTAVHGQRLVLEAQAVQHLPPLGPAITLVQCLTQGDQIDDLVRMSTEAGVSAIHFATSTHSAPAPNVTRSVQRHARLHRIAVQACRQSERAYVPTLHPPAPLHACAAAAPQDACKLVFWEHGCLGMWHHLSSVAPYPACWLVVGPEGGLDANEVAALQGLGYVAGRLRGPILRAATAAAVAVALAFEASTSPP